MRRSLALIAFVALTLPALSATAVARGPDYLGGKVRTGQVVTVPASETVRGDLYVFAGTINLDGTVNGDLAVFGGQINVNGTVNGSILAAGGSLILGGQTTGTIRASGGQIAVSGAVGKDLAVAAGQLSTTSAAKVGGDVIFAAGATTLAGPVNGSVAGSTGSYDRSGSLGGTEDVEISQRASPATAPAPSQPALDALRHLIAVLIVGVLILLARPRLLATWDELMRARPAASLGYGVLAIIAFMAAVVVALIGIVVIAIILGVLTLGALVAVDVVGGLLLVAAGILAWVVILTFVVDAAIGYSVGRAILGGRTTLGSWQTVTELGLGVAIVAVIEAVPVLGGIAKLLIVLFGLGAFAVWAWNARRTLLPRSARVTPT